MLWIYLVPNEFYFFICKHRSFNVLNKLLVKYQNASKIVNYFVVENNEHFLRLREYFKRNAKFMNTFSVGSFQNISVEWMIMV